MNSKTQPATIVSLREAAVELITMIDAVGPEDGLTGGADKIATKLSTLKSFGVSRPKILEYMLARFPEWYGPLPTHLYEINSKAMHALKEQMVSNIAMKFTDGAPYSKTTAGGFFNMGRTVDGENVDLPMEIFQVNREDTVSYLEDWLKCNGGHSKFQFNVEQAQRHEELSKYQAGQNGDAVPYTVSGELYVADVSGRKAWLYKTRFMVSPIFGGNVAKDVATMIENLHEFYDEVFQDQGLTMRVIYVKED